MSVYYNNNNNYYYLFEIMVVQFDVSVPWFREMDSISLVDYPQ